MKLTLLILLLIGLFIHGLISALALMQASRFRYLSPRNRWVSWAYALCVLTIGITSVVLFLNIDV